MASSANRNSTQRIGRKIITCLHYLALLKQVPDAYDHNMGDKERYFKLLKCLSAEDIQLYYQIALHGRRDLPLAPDQRNGLEMVLLRMLAFRPDTGSDKKVNASVLKSVTSDLDGKRYRMPLYPPYRDP